MRQTNPADSSAGVPDGWRRIGSNLVRVDGDLVFNRIVDAMTLEDSKQLVAICTEVVEQYGYVLVLTDNTRAGVPTPGARKFQTEQLRRPLHPSQTVVYGSSLIGRTSVSMVLRAVALFTGQRLPIAMVADEKSARELLSAARERFRAQGIAKR